MSGSRPTPAEQHLGDRLSALVDGELGHETRDRVLAHLATCAKCKSEADEQRRLKNVFAEAAPPPPSESFLARLQMLPAGGDGNGGSPLSGGLGGRLGGTAGGPGSPTDPSDSRGSRDSRDFADLGVFGSRESFGYVPSGPHGGALTPSEGRGLLGGGRGASGGRGLLGDRGFLTGRGFLGDRGALGDRGFLGGGRGASGGADDRTGREETPAENRDARGGGEVTGDRGFRIHDVSRQAAERSASRGMRFAFVAAGAVSLAAIALGGVTNGVPVETVDARGGSGADSNVTPLRTPASGTVPAPEAQRRRGSVAPLLGQGQQSLGNVPVAPTEISAPLLPGVPAPAGPDSRSVHPLNAHSWNAQPLNAPVLAGAAVMSPLIRPLTAAPPQQLTDWSPTPELVGPGLLTAPDATPSPTPTSPVLR